METKYTNGQWKFKTHDELVNSLPTTEVSTDFNDGKTPCEWIAKVRGNNLEEREANAKLMAAAPELLEACIEALKHHQGGHSEIGFKLKEAIKKATE